MQILVHLLIILAACGALWLGATWLVDAAARISRKFGVSDLVIGLTVVAFGTSAPEFAVTIGSAVRGNADIAVANVIGSNIFNIGFILGAVALFMNVKTGPQLVWRDMTVLLGTCLFLWVLLLDGELARWEGALFFGLLIAYLAFLFIRKETAMEEEISQKPATWLDGPLLLAGLGLIFAGQHFLVDSAVFLAERAGVSEFVIGMTIVAAGTSVPEFAISMISVIKKYHGISAGNLVGSNIFNTLGVLGLAGAIQPLAGGEQVIASMVAQAGLTLIVLIVMRTAWQVRRFEGILLILVSLLIWGYNFKLGQIV